MMSAAAAQAEKVDGSAGGSRRVAATGAVSRAARRAYSGITLALAVVGIAVATAAGWGEPRNVAAGALGAWVLQAVAFWRLAGALMRGESATRTWVLGIGARFGGLVLAFVADLAAGAGHDLPLAFGAAILVFLLLEAAWLARRPRSTESPRRRAPPVPRGRRAAHDRSPDANGAVENEGQHGRGSAEARPRLGTDRS